MAPELGHHNKSFVTVVTNCTAVGPACAPYGHLTSYFHKKGEALEHLPPRLGLTATLAQGGTVPQK